MPHVHHNRSLIKAFSLRGFGLTITGESNIPAGPLPFLFVLSIGEWLHLVWVKLPAGSFTHLFTGDFMRRQKRGLRFPEVQIDSWLHTYTIDRINL